MNSSSAMTFSPGGGGGEGDRAQKGSDKPGQSTRMHTALAHCTRMHKARVRREAQPPLQRAVRAMGIHDTGETGLQSQKQMKT